MKPFADRVAAGRALASRLQQYRGRSDVVVLGLPRGGVPVAFEVAHSVGAPLDVMIVRKLGAPGQPELALGAVASGGVTVTNEEIMAWFRSRPGLQHELEQQEQQERAELERRERAYRGERPPLDARDKTLILVDDGAATGASMLAAVRAARKLGARSVVVALPVASMEACSKLLKEADDVVCLGAPPSFAAVGMWYLDFSQTSDAEVTELLARAHLPA